jgi:hypothetical protein
MSRGASGGEHRPRRNTLTAIIGLLQAHRPHYGKEKERTRQWEIILGWDTFI